MIFLHHGQAPSGRTPREASLKHSCRRSDRRSINAAQHKAPGDSDSGRTAYRGLVVPVADTVNRPQSPAAAATHALLRHLEQVGFDGAPRYLGKDDRGRDVLSFVEAMPHPALSRVGADRLHPRQRRRACSSISRRGADLRPARYRWPTSVPQEFHSGLVCHNDVNLDNVIFRHGEAVGLIDFDLASPGIALWDIAMVAGCGCRSATRST